MSKNRYPGSRGIAVAAGGVIVDAVSLSAIVYNGIEQRFAQSVAEFERYSHYQTYGVIGLIGGTVLTAAGACSYLYKQRSAVRDRDDF